MIKNIMTKMFNKFNFFIKFKIDLLNGIKIPKFDFHSKICKEVLIIL